MSLLLVWKLYMKMQHKKHARKEYLLILNMQFWRLSWISFVSSFSLHVDFLLIEIALSSSPFVSHSLSSSTWPSLCTDIIDNWCVVEKSSAVCECVCACVWVGMVLGPGDCHSIGYLCFGYSTTPLYWLRPIQMRRYNGQVCHEEGNCICCFILVSVNVSGVFYSIEFD